MEERTWNKCGVPGKKKKKKRKLNLLACLLFCTVNILLLCKKIATRKNKKQKYRILIEISILSKTPWWLLIHLAFLLSLSQQSEWQHHPVIFLSNGLTYWSFADRTNSCWLLCPKYQARVPFSLVHIFSRKWTRTRRSSHAASVVWIQQLWGGVMRFNFF